MPPVCFLYAMKKSYLGAMNYFQISSIHVDPLEEPVVDVALGGYDLPYQDEGFVSVWVVTINGRVSNDIFV